MLATLCSSKPRLSVKCVAETCPTFGENTGALVSVGTRLNGFATAEPAGSGAERGFRFMLFHVAPPFVVESKSPVLVAAQPHSLLIKLRLITKFRPRSTSSEFALTNFPSRVANVSARRSGCSRSFFVAAIMTAAPDWSRAKALGPKCSSGAPVLANDLSVRVALRVQVSPALSVTYSTSADPRAFSASVADDSLTGIKPCFESVNQTSPYQGRVGREVGSSSKGGSLSSHVLPP